MTFYNVSQTVVDVVEADNAEAAARIFVGRLEDAGFEPYERADVFESEPDTQRDPLEAPRPVTERVLFRGERRA